MAVVEEALKVFIKIQNQEKILDLRVFNIPDDVQDLRNPPNNLREVMQRVNNNKVFNPLKIL